MKRTRRLVVAAFILALLAWTFRPYPAIDEAKVHPLLRGLDDSTKCGWTSIGDGGSVVIHIQPSDGREIVLCLSNSLDQSFFEIGRLYIGAPYFSDPGSTRITGYDHTQYVVARLLAFHFDGKPEKPIASEAIGDHGCIRSGA